MKIAYYEENDYHLEIFGSILEYCLENKIEIHLYNNGDKSGFMDYYAQHIIIYPTTSDNLLNFNYDYYIIGTTPVKTQIFSLMDQKKIIPIYHLKSQVENKKSIALSPLNKIHENNNYALPIDNLHKNTKAIKDRTIFGFVGRFKNNNRNIPEIINLVQNYDIEIYFFMRNKKFVPNEINNLQKKYPDKVKIFLKFKINKIIDYLNKVKFIVPFINNSDIYTKDRLTGMIPFSFNFNIPIILTNKLKNIYNLDCLSYDNNISEIMEEITTISNSEYEHLCNKLTKNKSEIMSKNKKIYQNLFIEQ